MNSNPLANWHKLVKNKSPVGLEVLLADEVVFYSPVLFAPQVGKALTTMYLSAAFEVLFNGSFHYVREVVGDSSAVLEFEVDLDGVLVNGVDIITWNDQGEIVEFKVMVRPYKAINEVKERMLRELQKG